MTEANLTEHYSPSDILFCGTEGCVACGKFPCASCERPICGDHSYDLDGNRDLSETTGRHCGECVDEWQKSQSKKG